MSLPRGSGPPTPAAVARALLDHIEAWYAEHEDDRGAVPPPARRYVAGGAPREAAWDEELGQLTVAYDRVVTGARPTAPAQPARLPRVNPANAGRLVRSVVLEVQMVRPAPALDFWGRIPGRDELDAHGFLLGLDADHLAAACLDAAAGGHLTRDNVPEAEILLGDCQTLGPAGQVAAVAQILTVPLL